MKISPEQSETELLKLAQIVINLRKTTKHWQEHFGAINRNKMKFWEEKADEWISKNVMQS